MPSLPVQLSCSLAYSVTWFPLKHTACLPPYSLLNSSFSGLPPAPLLQLPDTVKQAFERGRQLAAQKDAAGVVCIPASQVKEGEQRDGGTGEQAGLT